MFYIMEQENKKENILEVMDFRHTQLGEKIKEPYYDSLQTTSIVKEKRKELEVKEKKEENIPETEEFIDSSVAMSNDYEKTNLSFGSFEAQTPRLEKRYYYTMSMKACGAHDFFNTAAIFYTKKRNCTDKEMGRVLQPGERFIDHDEEAQKDLPLQIQKALNLWRQNKISPAMMKILAKKIMIELQNDIDSDFY